MQKIFNILYKYRQFLLLCLVLWLAYYIRSWGIKVGLPYPWHGDEPQVMHTALRILKTGDYNPHFFAYPTLIIYLQTINLIFCYFYAIGHNLLKNLAEISTNADSGWWFTISHPIFYEWGRRLTAIFGTLSVGLVYLLCSRYYSSLLTAFLASFFLACNIGHLNLSMWTTVDVPTAFFVLATAFSSVVLLLKGEKKHYLITGLLAGLTVSAKYNAWPVVLLPLLGHILNKKKNNLFSPNVLFFIVTIPLGFLIGCPYAFGDLPRFLKGAGYEVWHYSNVGEDTTFYQQLMFYYTGFCQELWAVGCGGGVGIFTLYAAFLGMISGFFINWRVHLLLLAYPIAFVCYMSTMKVAFMRNMIAVNPFLCIFAGLFISQFLNFASAILKKLKVPDMYRIICISLAIIVLLINPLYKAKNWAIEAYQSKDSRSLAVQWMKKNVKQPQKAAFVNELRWFKPDLDKLGFEYILIGQLEEDPVWFWNEGFDYLVVGAKYTSDVDAKKVLLPKYEQSFATLLNMTIAENLGTGSFILDGFAMNPGINILKVDANFCDAKYWEKNSNFFDFNLSEFKGNRHNKNHPIDDLSKQATREINTPFCSPKIVFEQGKYEVEITAVGASGARFFPVIKLESIKWSDSKHEKIQTIGEWQVEGLKTFKSGEFNCSKGDVMSFTVVFSNSENNPDKASNIQLNIARILVKKKA
jgi:hypothetical protein